MCRGTLDAAAKKADYHGLKSCYAGTLIQKGDKYCIYGCLGFGDCVKVCNFSAIEVGEDGLPHIHKDHCTGCGLCVKACPNKLLELHPESRNFFVFCKSFDDPKASRKYCKNACLGCKLCARGAKNSEIEIENNLAYIRNTKILDDEEAMKWVAKCPTKAIDFQTEK